MIVGELLVSWADWEWAGPVSRHVVTVDGRPYLPTNLPNPKVVLWLSMLCLQATRPRTFSGISRVGIGSSCKITSVLFTDLTFLLRRQVLALCFLLTLFLFSIHIRLRTDSARAPLLRLLAPPPFSREVAPIFSDKILIYIYFFSRGLNFP